MENLIKIGNQEISVKEFNNQRVVTFKDIDTVHERPEGTAGRNFRENRNWFIEGTDFYKVCADEIRSNKIMDISNKVHQDIVLITESGYLMIVKSLNDDLAWKVQRQLVDTYFRKVKSLSLEDMMRIQLGMFDESKKQITNHESRIENLENNMTLDYGQQIVLGDMVNKTVICVLGGKKANAYKEMGKKVFAECNRDLKHYFNVNSRNNIPKKRFDEAIEYADNWKPCTNTIIHIRDCNAQIGMEDIDE